MERSDWEELFSYLEIVADAHRVICKARDAGKEQVSTRGKAIERFAQAQPKQELFIRLGKLAGQTAGT